MNESRSATCLTHYRCGWRVWPQTEAQAAGSMRATAGDMAAFLIELPPQHLSTEMATQMRTPQVELSNDLSWGLGPSIQHSQQGDALWQ